MIIASDSEIAKVKSWQYQDLARALHCKWPKSLRKSELVSRLHSYPRFISWYSSSGLDGYSNRV
jgi:hypothetical protein